MTDPSVHTIARLVPGQELDERERMAMPTSPPIRWSAPNQPGLIALLNRLESESRRPWFHDHREQAWRLALRPYMEPSDPAGLRPLPEESDLAWLYAYVDYCPDGQPPLIDEIRDAVSTDPTAEEERVWIAPLSRSYMDVLDIIEVQGDWPEPSLLLQSLGDGREDRVPIAEPNPVLQKGRMLLTRIVRGPTVNSLPGAAIVLSRRMGQTLFAFSDELRREIEADLMTMEDWPEFAKAYGYLLLWSLAKVRHGAATVAEANIQYFDAQGQPFLFAIAVYEHHEFRYLAQELDQWEDWTAVHPTASERPSGQAASPAERVWIQTVGSDSETEASYVVARLTVTPILVIIEADSPQRLETIKRRLVAAFGFSLAFRGETTTPPPHTVPHVDLLSDVVFSPAMTVTREEEHRLLASFLESVLFRWAEEPCPALGGQTPRHAVKSGQAEQVIALIDQLERDDLAYRRTGTVGYDYNGLRVHLGLPERRSDTPET